MIKLERMCSDHLLQLNLIAEWRNESLISLRGNEKTKQGQSQVDWVNSFTDKERYYFINNCEQSRPPQFIGYCGLDKISWIHKTAEMSLLIDPKRHGEGFGSETVKELLRVGFEDLNLNCIFIEVILSSTGNIKFWRKQGFIDEGRLRSRYYKKGIFKDAIVCSILKSDWELKRTNKLLEELP